MKKFYSILLVVVFVSCFAVASEPLEYKDGDNLIFRDDEQGIILYSNKNGLICSENGVLLLIDPDLSIKVNEYDEVSRMLRAEQSPDTKTICFYGESGETYLFNLNNKTVARFPVDKAKIFYDSDGAAPMFYSNIRIQREGMMTLHTYFSGLYLINSDFSSKNLINDEYHIKSNKYDNNIAKFIIKKEIEPIGMAYWYNTKTNYSGFEEYLPQNDNTYKNTIAKTMRFSDLSLYNISRYDGGTDTPVTWVSGNYAISRYNDGFARYNLNSRSKTEVPAPITIINNYIFYFETPYVSGPIYRMHINNLLPQWTSIGYASSYGIWKGGGNINFLNTTIDESGMFIDIPYSLNTKTGVFGKITEEQHNAQYYRVFDACKGRKLCTWRGNAHLYNKGFRLVRSFSNSKTVYINGYLYTVGRDAEQRAVIEKVDLDGRTVDVIYKTSPYADIYDLTTVGNRIYFSAGGVLNLYGVNINGTKLIKY